MSTTESPNGNADVQHGYMTVHDWESDDAISDTLIGLLNAVSEITLAEDDPLYDVVDLDAIDALFHHSSRGCQSLSFRYQHCEIMIEGDGRILVHPPLPTE